MVRDMGCLLLTVLFAGAKLALMGQMEKNVFCFCRIVFHFSLQIFLLNIITSDILALVSLLPS